MRWVYAKRVLLYLRWEKSFKEKGKNIFFSVGSAAKDNTKEGGLKIIFDW